MFLESLVLADQDLVDKACPENRADTSHDCLGGGTKSQNFPTMKPSTIAATTTVVGTYIYGLSDRSNSSVTKTWSHFNL